MNRRKFLLAGAGAALSGLAGCTSGESRTTTTDTTTSMATTTTTTTTTTQEPTTQEPTTTTNVVEEWRSIPTEIGIEDLTTLVAGEAMVKKYFRYYDAESDSLTRLYPNNGHWIEAALRFENLGGSPVDAPDPTTPILTTFEGEEYQAHTEVPEISWDDIRLRDYYKAFWVELGYLGPSGEIDGGDSLLLYVLFDAGVYSPPFIQWNGRAVRPDRIIFPDGVLR